MLEDAGAISIEDMARDALAIMDVEGIPAFHLAGHSMGGLIAQEIALNAPDRVKSLALLCTFVRGAEGARMTPAMIATALRMRIGTKRMRRNAFLELIMPGAHLRGLDRPALATELAPLFGYDLASQPHVVMRQVRAMARHDAASRWQELGPLPALVVSAEYDRIALPVYGRHLASLLAQARYVEVPDAGHGVTIQCPREIAALLREHLHAAEQAWPGRSGARAATAVPATADLV